RGRRSIAGGERDHRDRASVSRRASCMMPPMRANEGSALFGQSRAPFWSRGRLCVLRDLAALLITRKGLHLLPIVLVLCVFGLLLISAQGSVVAPSIYTLF